MTTILPAEQLDVIRASCTTTTYGAPQTLDSGTFQALAASGLNLSKTTPLICAPGQVICREGEPGDAHVSHPLGPRRHRQRRVRRAHRAGLPRRRRVRRRNGAAGKSAALGFGGGAGRSAICITSRATIFSACCRTAPISTSACCASSAARLREADDLITTTTHARRSLRSQVDELAAENQQLLELQRLREQTTDLVVHDLRNPLHSIMGAVGMLQMVLPPTLCRKTAISSI